jgi:hypothetical protein
VEPLNFYVLMIVMKKNLMSVHNTYTYLTESILGWFPTSQGAILGEKEFFYLN